MTTSIIKFKPSVDTGDSVIARDKGWYCKSPDKDGEVLLTEFDHDGGFLAHLVAEGVSGEGIPSVTKAGFVSLTSDLVSSNLGGYDSDYVYIMVDATGGLGSGAIVDAVDDSDHAFEVGVGLVAGGKAEVGIYEYEGDKPTVLVGKVLVHNDSGSVGWATDKIDVQLAKGKKYVVGVHSISGTIIEKAKPEGIKRYPVVDGEMPVDVSAVDPTGSDWNLAAYVSVAKY
ncbi:hypothetical protein VPHD528_0091 [Vibrio phage D528]